MSLLYNIISRSNKIKQRIYERKVCREVCRRLYQNLVHYYGVYVKYLSKILGSEVGLLEHDGIMVGCYTLLCIMVNSQLNVLGGGDARSEQVVHRRGASVECIFLSGCSCSFYFLVAKRWITFFHWALWLCCFSLEPSYYGRMHVVGSQNVNYKLFLQMI